MWLLLCMLIAAFCAIFGVRAFTGAYTCRLAGFNAGVKKACVSWFWVPSAVVVALVMCLVVSRANLLLGGYGGGGY